MITGKEMASLGIKKCITTEETALGESEPKCPTLCLATWLPFASAYHVEFMKANLKANNLDFLLCD